ncbi:MAG: hypothetical protein U0746_21885 [Gemmataceae bacterium]
MRPAPSTPRTRAPALKRGVLEVEVQGAVRMQELAHFHKRRLLEALRSLLPGTTLSDLRFPRDRLTRRASRRKPTWTAPRRAYAATLAP